MHSRLGHALRDGFSQANTRYNYLVFGDGVDHSLTQKPELFRRFQRGRNRQRSCNQRLEVTSLPCFDHGEPNTVRCRAQPN